MKNKEKVIEKLKDFGNRFRKIGSYYESYILVGTNRTNI